MTTPSDTRTRLKCRKAASFVEVLSVSFFFSEKEMWDDVALFDPLVIWTKHPGVDIALRDATVRFVDPADVTQIVTGKVVGQRHRRAVAIRASPGTGKTEAAGSLATAFVEKHPLGNIVFITPRVTLAENVTKRLAESTGIPFTLYNDPSLPRKPSRSNSSVQHFVVQVESLHRFVDVLSGDEPVCVIVDEFLAVLTQLSSTFTHGGGGGQRSGTGRGSVEDDFGRQTSTWMETTVCSSGRTPGAAQEAARVQFRAEMSESAKHHAATITQFFGLFRNRRNYAAVFDAFLSNFAVSLLCNLVGNTETSAVSYARLPDQRVFISIPPNLKSKRTEERSEPLISHLICLLATGRSAYVFSSSKKMVTVMKNRILRTFGEGFPVFVATGDETTQSLTDVDVSWTAARVVLTTSKVTVGVNYTVQGHFDAVFCYVLATCKNRVRDVFQALFRVRHPKTPNIFVLVDDFVHPETAGDLCGPDVTEAQCVIRKLCCPSSGEPPIALSIRGGLVTAYAQTAHHAHLHRTRAVLAELRCAASDGAIERTDFGLMKCVFAQDEYEVAISTIRVISCMASFADSCGFLSRSHVPETFVLQAEPLRCEAVTDAARKYHFSETPPWTIHTPIPKKPKKNY